MYSEFFFIHICIIFLNSAESMCIFLYYLVALKRNKYCVINKNILILGKTLL